jgi:hypothetical protein
MLPTLRLMIAATLASVVVLICGFGMFAVFHVGHEPLVRLPVTTAPLQLVADNATRSTAGLTSSDAFDVRFAVKAPSSPAEAPDMSAAAIEPRATEPRATEPMAAEPEPAARPDAAGPAATSSTTDEATWGISKDDPPADDEADRAASPQPQPTFSTMAAAAASPPPDATTAEPEPIIKAPGVTVAADDPAPSPAIEIVANEPANPPTAYGEHPDPASPERASPTVAPTGAASSGGPRPAKGALKKPKRIHTVARRSHAPRLIIVRYVRARYQQAQYAPTEQGFGAAQDQNFQTAPTQYGAAPPVRIRYLRIVVRKAAPPAAGIGGPFVRATSRQAGRD